MTIKDIQPWEHYRTKSKLYLVIDITDKTVVLMLVWNYLPGEARKFRHYLHDDFIYLVDEKKVLERFVPTLK